jgi:threonine synthase
MDIQLPSNFERLIFDLAGNAAPVAGVMVGRAMTPAMRTRLGLTLSFARVSQSATLARMRDLFERTGYMADPHTAVALEAAALGAVALGAACKRDDRSRHLVALATAHPAKFAETLRDATGQAPPLGRRGPAALTSALLPVAPNLPAVLEQIERVQVA